MELKQRARGVRAGALIFALGVLISSCVFRDRNQLRWFEKPPPAAKPAPFVKDLLSIGEARFTVEYTLAGTGVTSWATVAYSKPRALVKTNIGGLNLDIYVDFEQTKSPDGHVQPFTALACASVAGIQQGCRPLDSKAQSQETNLVSPQMYDTLVGLFSIPGAKVTEERLVGTDALCLEAPPTDISDHIKLCLAKLGGVLFYTNGQLTISAKRYQTTVDTASLVPPADTSAPDSPLG